MLQLHDSDIDLNIDFDLSFVSNQTSNIFYLKILYALFLAFDLLYTNSNITFYKLVLAFSRKKILYIL